MSAKTDLPDAILEVLGAGQDFDFHAHEIDGEIAPVDFGKADRVFLGGDDGQGLALSAAVDGVQDFLLRKAMVVGKSLAVDQFSAEAGQAFLEALRLGN